MDDVIQRFKEKARKRLRETWRYLYRPEFGCVPVWASEGEAANLLDFPYGVPSGGFQLAFTNDGVGTKTMVAFLMSQIRLERKRIYGHRVGSDLVAANTIDLTAMGATPLWLLDDIQVGSKECLADEDFTDGILDGILDMCHQEKVGVTGGETALMRDVVVWHQKSLSAAAMGIVSPRSRAILHTNLKNEDVILGFPAPSLQTNGFTLARDIVVRLLHGYFTELPSGRILGEVLLRRSVTWTKEMMALFDMGVEIHYASHLSGGGWQKIKRAPQNFTYEIAYVPEPSEIFKFLQESGRVDDKTAYQTWNMGVGFVIFVPRKEVEWVKKICANLGTQVFELGRVITGPRKVVLVQKNIIL